MSQATINVGAAPDDGTGDTLRAAFVKVEANFDELYNLASGSIVVGAGAGGAPLTYTNLTYTETSGPRLQVGSSGTSDGITVGYAGISGVGGIWASGVGTKNNTTAGFLISAGGNTYINAPSGGSIFTTIGNATTKQTQSSTAGAGPAITAGTATTDVQALSATQTWNASGVTFTGIKYTLTNSASAAGSKLLDLIVGSTSTFDVHKTGVIGQAGVAFASLPTGVAGMLAYVTDASTATWGATIAGGGANKVLAFYNGTNWTVAGA